MAFAPAHTFLRRVISAARDGYAGGMSGAPLILDVTGLVPPEELASYPGARIIKPQHKTRPPLRDAVRSAPASVVVVVCICDLTIQCTARAAIQAA
jgi:hypothetical protein